MKTTGYEISKRLNEAGFKGGSDCCYLYDGRLIRDGQEFGYHPTICDGESIVDCFSYDLETILEALPKRIDINGVGCRFEMYSFADLDRNELISIGYMRTRNFTVLSSKNESLADCAAKMWLKLKKENLI